MPQRRYPPAKVGNPPDRTACGVFDTPRGRYVSCVHAGGLSCSTFFEDTNPTCEPLNLLFWPSGDVFPGFQSQDGSLAGMLCCLLAS